MSNQEQTGGMPGEELPADRGKPLEELEGEDHQASTAILCGGM